MKSLFHLATISVASALCAVAHSQSDSEAQSPLYLCRYIATLQSELDKDLKRFTEEHPDVMALRRALRIMAELTSGQSNISIVQMCATWGVSVQPLTKPADEQAKP